MTSQACPLLNRLPTEIRLHIYEYTFSPSDSAKEPISVCAPRWSTGRRTFRFSGREKTYDAIARTCRRIRNESLPAFRSNTFVFCIARAVEFGYYPRLPLSPRVLKPLSDFLGQTPSSKLGALTVTYRVVAAGWWLRDTLSKTTAQKSLFNIMLSVFNETILRVVAPPKFVIDFELYHDGYENARRTADIQICINGSSNLDEELRDNIDRLSEVAKTNEVILPFVGMLESWLRWAS